MLPSIMRRTLQVTVIFMITAFCLTLSSVSFSQTRDKTWGRVSTATAITAMGTSLLMPRIYDSSSPATVGWKARWHVSVLAPTMTQLSLAYLNQNLLKDAFKENRPGCNETGPGIENCETYALFSTPAYLAGASFGQGLGIFLYDTFHYNGGKLNWGSLAGHALVPLALGGVTVGGRAAGKYETFGQSLASAGVGVVTGVAMGLLYSGMQKPDCGYSGAMFCW